MGRFFRQLRPVDLIVAPFNKACSLNNNPPGASFNGAVMFLIVLHGTAASLSSVSGVCLAVIAFCGSALRIVCLP